MSLHVVGRDVQGAEGHTHFSELLLGLLCLFLVSCYVIFLLLDGLVQACHGLAQLSA